MEFSVTNVIIIAMFFAFICFCSTNIRFQQQSRKLHFQKRMKIPGVGRVSEMNSHELL